VIRTCEQKHAATRATRRFCISITSHTGPCVDSHSLLGAKLKSAEDLILGELDADWAQILEEFGQGHRHFSQIMQDASFRVANGRGMGPL
jgi:hypothetical protein